MRPRIRYVWQRKLRDFHLHFTPKDGAFGRSTDGGLLLEAPPAPRLRVLNTSLSLASPRKSPNSGDLCASPNTNPNHMSVHSLSTSQAHQRSILSASTYCLGLVCFGEVELAIIHPQTIKTRSSVNEKLLLGAEQEHSSKMAEYRHRSTKCAVRI